MNAAYLIYGESLGSNLVRRQVLDVIVGLRKRLDIERYYLIVFLQWDRYIRRRGDTRRIVDHLKDEGILCRIIPVPVSFPVYRPGKGWKMRMAHDVIAVPVMLLIALPTVLFFIIARRARLLHCRGYVSAVPALVARLLVRGVRFIFDPRSDYPEEAAVEKAAGMDGMGFKFWKRLEREYLEHADVVVTVGENFDRHYKKIYGDTVSEVIYNNVDTGRFTADVGFRDAYRKEKGLEGKTVFCYSGSLNENYWNDPEPYAGFMRQCASVNGRDAAFLFLIPDYCRAPLAAALTKYGIGMERCILESPRFEDVPKYLSVGDVGMYFLPYHSPRVGTKFVEYCSVGLPSLVNGNAGGATELIDLHGLGYSLHDFWTSRPDGDFDAGAIRSVARLVEQCGEYGRRCREFALDNFDNNVVADRYGSVYKILLDREQ